MSSNHDQSMTPSALHMPSPAEMAVEVMGGHKPHASPAVRSFARELGVDLALINGSGPNARITFDDVKHHVKAVVEKAYAQKFWP